MSDTQNLNSLDRFRKNPGRLILEAHSHCEIPAGCGGVVLRWRNPQAALPLTFYLYSPVAAKCLLDGAVLPAARNDVTPGKHVLTIALEKVNLAEGLLLFVAVHEPMLSRNQVPPQVVEGPLKFVTAADGTWKYTLKEPPTEWSALSFDDRSWAALTQMPAPQLAPSAPGAYRCRQCIERGAACLGIAPPAGQDRTSLWQRLLGEQPRASAVPVLGNVWVRKVFEVPATRAAELPVGAS
jgi:hypothetical protein